MNDAIKLAIEGGWNIKGTLEDRLPTLSVEHVNDFWVKVLLVEKTWIDDEEGNPKEVNMTSTCPPDKVLLDPLFWQALGKSCGWQRKFAVASYGTTGEIDIEDKNYLWDGVKEDDFSLDRLQEEWQYRWHRFIDHLAEGKDAESFFTNLLTQ